MRAVLFRLLLLYPEYKDKPVVRFYRARYRPYNVAALENRFFIVPVA